MFLVLFCFFLFLFSGGRHLNSSETGRERGQQALVGTRQRQTVRELFLQTAGGKAGAPQPAGHLLPLSLQAASWVWWRGSARCGCPWAPFSPSSGRQGTPGKRGQGWRPVECGGSGVVPEGGSTTESGTLAMTLFVQNLPPTPHSCPSQAGASRDIKNQLPALTSPARPCAAPWACLLITGGPRILNCLLWEAGLDAVPINGASITPSLSLPV